jgi:hypothetical protein
MSATAIFRRAWEDLWRNPGVFNLVFWSLMLALGVDYVFESRLAPLLPAALTNPRTWLVAPPPAGFWRHLPPDTVLRFGLFGATALFVVTPFRVAGLYGGAAELIRGRSPRWLWFQFFTTGWKRFWRGLETTVAGLLLGLALMLVLIGFSVLGGAWSVLGIVLLLVWVALGLWAVGLGLVGLGALMAADRRLFDVLGEALTWAVRHRGLVFRLGAALVGLLVVVLLVVAGLAAIPLVGPVASVVGLWIVTGFGAVLPTTVYRETVERSA